MLLGIKRNDEKHKLRKSSINKKCFAVVILFVSFIFLVACNQVSLSASSYLRIHIRANSNSNEDQNVKYEVRTALIDYITPIVSNIDTKEELIEKLNLIKNDMESVANEILTANGFSYNSNIEIRNELFPSRYYGEYLLPSDYYDALIVELGGGKGDNWWCVVYPPLCFVNNNTDKVVYSSKIWEIINKFKNN